MRCMTITAVPARSWSTQATFIWIEEVSIAPQRKASKPMNWRNVRPIISHGSRSHP